MILYGKHNKTQAAALEFFAKELLTPQLKSYIIINLRFVKNLPVCGFTEVDGYNSKNKPREFILEINRDMSEKQTLKTLAHEMTHVKQFAYGEIDERGTKWLSRKLDHDSVPYHKRPWEIEAFQAEERLYKKWIQALVNDKWVKENKRK
jgi:hypothetical protein